MINYLFKELLDESEQIPSSVAEWKAYLLEKNVSHTHLKVILRYIMQHEPQSKDADVRNFIKAADEILRNILLA